VSHFNFGQERVSNWSSQPQRRGIDRRRQTWYFGNRFTALSKDLIIFSTDLNSSYLVLTRRRIRAT
jgi:hypothetical protein